MATWSELSQELDRWHDTGATATFWWRDDDAAEDTPQLDVLLKHAGAIPLALAVIPALATQSLAARIANHSSIVVLQHGWCHDNHASGSESEYPAGRSWEQVSQELVDGRRILTSLFGPQALPVFVPPWLGFDTCFLPLLRRSGLTAISRKGPRTGLFAAGRILQANAHMSPIKWSNPPSFEGDDHYLDRVIAHLRGRRLGAYDATEATGLLTHHLVQNDKSYAFISRLVGVVSEHPACIWMDATNIFSPEAAANETAGKQAEINAGR